MLWQFCMQNMQSAVRRILSKLDVVRFYEDCFVITVFLGENFKQENIYSKSTYTFLAFNNRKHTHRSLFIKKCELDPKMIRILYTFSFLFSFIMNNWFCCVLSKKLSIIILALMKRILFTQDGYSVTLHYGLWFGGRLLWYILSF